MLTNAHEAMKAMAMAAGVAAAQAEARRTGFRWGALVAHPSNERVCELRGIVGDTAHLLDAVDGMVQVPASELFDPTVAEREAVRAALLSAAAPN